MTAGGRSTYTYYQAQTLEREELETTKTLPNEDSSDETSPLLEEGSGSPNGTLCTKPPLIKPRLFPPQVIHAVLSYAIMSLHTIVFDPGQPDTDGHRVRVRVYAH